MKSILNGNRVRLSQLTTADVRLESVRVRPCCLSYTPGCDLLAEELCGEEEPCASTESVASISSMFFSWLCEAWVGFSGGMAAFGVLFLHR